MMLNEFLLLTNLQGAPEESRVYPPCSETCTMAGSRSEKLGEVGGPSASTMSRRKEPFRAGDW